MNISYAPYELETIHALSVTSSAMKREGALLKVLFPSGIQGFADCHPWVELGDHPLKQQLEKLAVGELTALTCCALEYAALDAEYRSKGSSVFSNLTIPQSHFLVTNLFDWTPQHVLQVIQQGYAHVKLKMGRDLDREAECLHTLFLNTSLKLRLDFNESLAPQRFRYFLHRVEELKERIEFIEDPFPFDAAEWAAIQKEGWVLACDRQVQKGADLVESARVLIIKPALQSCETWQKWGYQTRIATSYLGHPLGQMAAAYVAAKVDPLGVFAHGLLSHHVYRLTVFSQHLNWKNPQFTLAPGRGFGFDKELSQLNWIPLK
jgi:o-succinylbenzoate synthase